MLSKLWIALFAVNLIAQPPLPQTFSRGELIEIVDHPETPSYEYTVYDGFDDAYTGKSDKPINVRLKAKVKFAIKGRALYIIDAEGKTQETVYFRQAEIYRPHRWKRHWWQIFR